MDAAGYHFSRVLKGQVGVDALQAVGLWPIDESSWPWWADWQRPRRPAREPPPVPEPRPPTRPLRPSPLSNSCGRKGAKMTLKALGLLTDR